MSRFKELGGDKYKSKFAEISQKLARDTKERENN